jgi:hypothetical protein
VKGWVPPEYDTYEGADRLPAFFLIAFFLIEILQGRQFFLDVSWDADPVFFEMDESGNVIKR